VTDKAANTTGPADRWTLILSAFGVVVVWCLAFTAPDPLFLAPFRESQTAISADWLVREPAGGMLAYQTPVLGPPWRLPLEFPLFQQLCAWGAAAGLGVATSGRLLSLICWIGCLAVLWKLLPTWGLPEKRRVPALALIAAAPLHTAYSVSLLIESMALLGALAHLWTFWRYSEAGGLKWWTATVVSGTMVSLVKITTWLPAGALTGALTLWCGWNALKTPERALRLRRCAWMAAAGILVLAAGLAWSKWCAGIREHNRLSAALFSEGGQKLWIFGNLRDRLSPKFNALLLLKHAVLLFGPAGIFVPWILWRGAGPEAEPAGRVAVLVPFSAYFAHAYGLFPLHLRHDYYLFGSGVFLIAAVAAALASIESRAGAPAWTRWAGPILAGSMVLTGTAHVLLRRGYRDVAADAALKAARAVSGGGALLTFGLDWSPRVPFAAGRKALMEPDDAPSPKSVRLLDDALKAADGFRFAGALVVGSPWRDEAGRMAARAGLDASKPHYFWPDAFLLLPTNSAPSVDLRVDDAPEIRDLSARVASTAQGGGLVFSRWPGSGRAGAGFEIVVKRDDDAFWVRSDGLQLVRVRGYFRAGKTR
jgi:hypothetical protein